jgi:hypothetical protein
VKSNDAPVKVRKAEEIFSYMKMKENLYEQQRQQQQNMKRSAPLDTTKTPAA